MRRFRYVVVVRRPCVFRFEWPIVTHVQHERHFGQDVVVTRKAYKDADAVMATPKDLVAVVHTLKQIRWVKA